MPQSPTEYNKTTYDGLWPQLSDFIRHNPGARHRRRHVFDLLASCRFDSILDVGCGDATLLRELDARWPGKRLCGVDLSPVVVEQNRRAFPAIRFEALDAETEALPDGFDVVLCSEVIEHVAQPDALMHRLAAAVAPGGHVILSAPTGRVWETERRFGHVRHPTPGDITVWARDAGLLVEELWTWGFPTYALTKWAQNLNADRTMRAFAGSQRYGVPQVAVSKVVWLMNFANVRSSPWGVQLFARMRRPRSMKT